MHQAMHLESNAYSSLRSPLLPPTAKPISQCIVALCGTPRMGLHSLGVMLQKVALSERG